MLADEGQLAVFTSLFRDGQKLTYRRGEFIIRPGETPAHVFFIEKGLVKAYSITKYGEENLLIIRKSQELFPLIWAITGQERSIIYEALVPTVVWRIPRDVFMDYLKKPTNPFAPLLDMTVEMYRIHSERLLNLTYRSVRERLISFLLMMSRRFGKRTKEGVLIDVPISQQNIASSINASRETASRELNYLEQKGLIKNKQQYTTLLDVKKLTSYL